MRAFIVFVLVGAVLSAPHMKRNHVKRIQEDDIRALLTTLQQMGIRGNGGNSPMQAIQEEIQQNVANGGGPAMQAMQQAGQAMQQVGQQIQEAMDSGSVELPEGITAEDAELVGLMMENIELLSQVGGMDVVTGMFEEVVSQVTEQMAAGQEVALVIPEVVSTLPQEVQDVIGVLAGIINNVVNTIPAEALGELSETVAAFIHELCESSSESFEIELGSAELPELPSGMPIPEGAGPGMILEGVFENIMGAAGEKRGQGEGGQGFQPGQGMQQMQQQAQQGMQQIQQQIQQGMQNGGGPAMQAMQGAQQGMQQIGQQIGQIASEESFELPEELGSAEFELVGSLLEAVEVLSDFVETSVLGSIAEAIGAQVEEQMAAGLEVAVTAPEAVADLSDDAQAAVAVLLTIVNQVANNVDQAALPQIAQAVGQFIAELCDASFELPSGLPEMPSGMEFPEPPQPEMAIEGIMNEVAEAMDREEVKREEKLLERLTAMLERALRGQGEAGQALQQIGNQIQQAAQGAAQQAMQQAQQVMQQVGQQIQEAIDSGSVELPEGLTAEDAELVGLMMENIELLSQVGGMDVVTGMFEEVVSQVTEQMAAGQEVALVIPEVVSTLPQEVQDVIGVLASNIDEVCNTIPAEALGELSETVAAFIHELYESSSESIEIELGSAELPELPSGMPIPEGAGPGMILEGMFENIMGAAGVERGQGEEGQGFQPGQGMQQIQQQIQQGMQNGGGPAMQAMQGAQQGMQQIGQQIGQIASEESIELSEELSSGDFELVGTLLEAVEALSEFVEIEQLGGLLQAIGEQVFTQITSGLEVAVTAPEGVADLSEDAQAAVAVLVTIVQEVADNIDESMLLPIGEAVGELIGDLAEAGYELPSGLPELPADMGLPENAGPGMAMEELLTGVAQAVERREQERRVRDLLRLLRKELN